jgi:RNA recognition motif-containing protein
MATKSLYVGNLPYDTTEDEIRNLFASYGVQSVRLISEKGFAFVDITAENVSDAIRTMNGKEVGGRALRVDEARPRPEREGGGGGFGGRGRGGGGRGAGRGGFADREGSRW